MKWLYLFPGLLLCYARNLKIKKFNVLRSEFELRKYYFYILN